MLLHTSVRAGPKPRISPGTGTAPSTALSAGALSMLLLFAVIGCTATIGYHAGLHSSEAPAAELKAAELVWGCTWANGNKMCGKRFRKAEPEIAAADSEPKANEKESTAVAAVESEAVDADEKESTEAVDADEKSATVEEKALKGR